MFPALAQQIHGHRLVYLDGAASKLMPQPVIDAVRDYQSRDHANVHRGVHTLSERATALFEEARESLRRFVNAASVQEIIFTRGATESLNMVARGLGERLRPGDEVIVSGLEHHANLVPWQMACARSGAVLRHIPVLDDGTLDEPAFESCCRRAPRCCRSPRSRTRSAPRCRCSDFVAKARQAGLVTVVDGAQAVAHGPVDVRALGCDFYAFSGHKMYGPTGIGVLYGRFEALDALPLWQGGGDMIETVTLQTATYAALPARLEAGTPNISGAVGLAAAVRFLESLGRERIGQREAELLRYLEASLRAAALDSRDRRGRAEGRRGVLRGRRRARARRRHGARPVRHRRAGRPPLRDAGDAALRRAGHGARVAQPAQHCARTSTRCWPALQAARERLS